MKRVRKIVENFVVCECQRKQQNPMFLFEREGTNICKPIKKIECPICHGKGLRVKKKIYFYPDDREF
jgi:hypothetical protein